MLNQSPQTQVIHSAFPPSPQKKHIPKIHFPTRNHRKSPFPLSILTPQNWRSILRDRTNTPLPIGGSHWSLGPDSATIFPGHHQRQRSPFHHSGQNPHLRWFQHPFRSKVFVCFLVMKVNVFFFPVVVVVVVVVVSINKKEDSHVTHNLPFGDVNLVCENKAITVFYYHLASDFGHGVSKLGDVIFHWMYVSNKI